jgi:hypothetical protein
MDFATVYSTPRHVGSSRIPRYWITNKLPVLSILYRSNSTSCVLYNTTVQIGMEKNMFVILTEMSAPLKYLETNRRQFSVPHLVDKVPDSL